MDKSLTVSYIRCSAGRAHLTGKAERLDGRLELAEEADVVFEVVAEVFDLPLEHGDALDAHTEGEAAVDFGIDAGGTEDVGVDHAAAENLEPAGTLADVAAFAVVARII